MRFEDIRKSVEEIPDTTLGNYFLHTFVIKSDKFKDMSLKDFYEYQYNLLSFLSYSCYMFNFNSFVYTRSRGWPTFFRGNFNCFDREEIKFKLFSLYKTHRFEKFMGFLKLLNAAYEVEDRKFRISSEVNHDIKQFIGMTTKSDIFVGDWSHTTFDKSDFRLRFKRDPNFYISEKLLTYICAIRKMRF